MPQYKNHHIKTNTNSTKDHNKKIYRKVKSSKIKYKTLHKQNVNAYIERVSKNSSEQDIGELFGLGTTFYLSENCFIEMHYGKNNTNYTFITAPEHVCNKPIKLNGITFQDMYLKVQEARRSDTRCNERRNITKSFFERNMKSAADSIYSPNILN